MKNAKRNLSIMWEYYNKELKMFIAFTVMILAFTIIMTCLINPWYLVLNIIYPALFLVAYRNSSRVINEAITDEEKINKYKFMLNKFNNIE